MINNEMLIGFGLVRLEDIVEPSASLRFKCTLEIVKGACKEIYIRENPNSCPQVFKVIKDVCSAFIKKTFERKPKIIHTHDERI